MVTNGLRSLLAEPRPAPPTTPAWWDRVLVALLVPTAATEALLREDLVWRPLALGLGVTAVFALLWRRKSPLLAFVLPFGALHAVQLVALLSDVPWQGLHTYAFVLLLPYSLFRWGAGREAAAGLGVMLAGYSFSALNGELESVGDAVGGAVVFLFPAVLGASARFRANAQARELDQAKLLEREALARELHDTVAHHVSAIAIQAQAGRAVAATRPDAAVEVLKVIEEEAARTLSEMRSIVSALRDKRAADLAPQSGIADIERLARSGAPGAEDKPVHVELSGDLDGLGPSVEAAIFRMAQESITNALRHARHASRIQVRVDGDDGVVRLTVTDDGDPPAFGAGAAPGFGLAGMAERAALLGGTFTAGPSPRRGWTVQAVLPRSGAAR